MRRRFHILVVLLLLAALGGVWFYAHREKLSRQWACYRVGAAGSLEEAQKEIAWFEAGPDRPARLDELARNWGTGNERFDLYVAGHLYAAAGSDALRDRFAAELGRRPELLPRWAHWWAWRTPLEPDQQVGSIVAYLDVVMALDDATSRDESTKKAGSSQGDSPIFVERKSGQSPGVSSSLVEQKLGQSPTCCLAGPKITWREILDLQAVFALTGQGPLAEGLSPTNWPDRYRRWKRNRPEDFPSIPRPEKAFAD